jgi:hypothetical protein
MDDRRYYVPGVFSLILRVFALVLFIIVGFAWATNFALPAPNAWLAFGLAFLTASWL